MNRVPVQIENVLHSYIKKNRDKNKNKEEISDEEKTKISDEIIEEILHGDKTDG